MKLYLVEIMRDVDPGRWAPLVAVMGVPLREILTHVSATLGKVEHIDDFRLRAISSSDIPQLPDNLKILARKTPDGGD